MIVEHSKKGSKDVLPLQFSAHATVQELGGGSLAIDFLGDLVFTDDVTGNVYRLAPSSGDVAPLIEAEKGIRYGDFSIHPSKPYLVLAIKEDHRNATPETQATAVINTLVLLDARTNTESTLVQGDDFYSHPRFSPSGSKISWIQWSHPNMPWTGTVLHTADWSTRGIKDVTRIAGESMKESIAQPSWGVDDTLFFSSDRSGFWQLFSLRDGSVNPIMLKGLEDSDFATAEWKLGR